MQSPTAMMMARIVLARDRQFQGIRPVNVASIEEFTQLVNHLAEMPEDLKTTFAHLAATVALFVEPVVASRQELVTEALPCIPCIDEASIPVEGFSDTTKTGIAKEVFDWVSRSTCNAFTVSDEELRSIGVGSYPQAALINHSCDPNCHVNFRGQLLRISVLKPIQKGEEITINYIDVAQTREARQSQLKASYYFTCKCARCEAKTTRDSMESTVARCPFCDGFVSRENVGQFRCNSCSSLDSSQLASVEARFELLTSLSAQIKSNPDLRTLQSILSQLLPFVRSDSFAMLECLNALSARAILELQFELAERYVSSSLQIHAKAFPTMHPLTGLQWATHAKLASYLGRDRDALNSARKATGILEITHGRDSPLLSTLEKLRHEIELEVGFAR